MKPTITAMIIVNEQQQQANITTIMTVNCKQVITKPTMTTIVTISKQQ